MKYIITRKFVMMPVFDKMWKSMGLTDDDLLRLQKELLEYPDIGKVVKGTGKLRKMKFAFHGRGKRGSVRVVYVDFAKAQTIFLIYAYPKNEKDNLTEAECSSIKKLIDKLERGL